MDVSNLSVGTKMVRGTAMNREEYNIYRGLGIAGKRKRC